MKTVTLVVPCYNEEEALPAFYAETSKVIDAMPYACEFLFVDDGSKDNTLNVIRHLAERDERVKYITFSRNFGKEAAMYAGFCNAGGDYVAVMDADLQDPPELLPQMLEMLETQDIDCVATRRADRTGEPPVRSWFARCFYRLINRLSDTEIVDGARDFRVMKHAMVEAVVAMSEYNRFSKGIFGWVGFKTHWLSYENRERVAGQTKWGFWGLVKYALDGIINFSQTPLSLASWFGLFMTAVAFVMLLFVIIRKLIFDDPVAGWASLVSVIIFIGGLQLFFLGIIGQYMAKLYLEAKHRPHFIAAESNLDHPTMLK